MQKPKSNINRDKIVSPKSKNINLKKLINTFDLVLEKYPVEGRYMFGKII